MFYDGRDLFRERSTPWLLGVVGRLQPGRARDRVASELSVIARQLPAATPNQRTTIRVTNGAMINTPGVREAAAWALPLIMAAPAIVLLIACANVALLLLSRSTARQQEIAVRVALGASRGRVLQMLLVESALLAAIALPPSLAVAYGAPRIVRSLILTLPYYPFAIDHTVVVYLAAVTLFAGIMAGIPPAVESLKRNVSPAPHGHDLLGSAVGWRARDLLIAAQVGMSLMLLVGAGLFLHAEAHMLSASPGYDTDHVMLVVPHVLIPPQTPESAAQFYEAFRQRALGIPGVRAFAYARGSTDELAGSSMTMIVARRTGVTATATTSVVSSQYFRTLQISVVSGAPFADDATSARSVMVSETLARTLWPGSLPVGETARLGDTDVAIAGVVRDVQSIVSGTGERTVYRPAGAIHAGDAIYMGFDGMAAPTARAIRNTIATLDSDAVALPLTLAAIRRDQAAKFMPLVEMVVALGIVGLVLGVAGIYGVVSFAVVRRTREMGIRIALGATHGDILRLILWSGTAPIAIGIGGGMGLALIASRTLARVFARTPVHIDAWDPLVYTGVTLVLVAAALMAMMGPAERAASSDPVHALRYD
jgi:predicted permease